MKTRVKYIFTTSCLPVAFCLCYFISYGQRNEIDSLQQVLKAAKEDTTKVNILNELSYQLYRVSNYDTALIHIGAAKQLAGKLNFSKGIAASYSISGNIYYNQGNYPEALKGHFAALRIRERIQDREGIAGTYSNIGNVYYSQGNFFEALKNYFASVKMGDKMGNDLGNARTYNNIGAVYYSQGNYPEALKSNFASLKIKEKIGDKVGIGNCYNNIGSVYSRQGNYSEALKFFFASLKIMSEIGNKRGIASAYNNIGLIYENQGNYPEALKNHFAALKIGEENGDKQLTATAYMNIGIVYQKQGNYSEALKNYFISMKIKDEMGEKDGLTATYIHIGSVYTTIDKAEEGKKWQEKALQLSKEIGNKEVTKNSYLGLAQADSALAVSALAPLPKRVEFAMSALENYKLYMIYKDSLINEETIQKSEREKNQYEFDKKEAEAEAERQKKEAIAVTERKKQQIILWSVSGGLLLVALFAGFVFRSLRITKRQKQVIEEQKLQIVESINYSKKIQESLLPSIESIQTAIPDLFLFYEPKAIVSGDFYYFKEFESYNLLACVDCTGHGVPGGFMSTLGSLLLDKIVNDEALSPSDILNKLSNEIIRVLHQQDGGEIQDGMDLSVCLIDKNSKTIEFSGARNGIIIVSNNTAKRYKVSSLPVGGNYVKKGVPIARNFETQSATVNPGDWIYMYTDGFMEQRGGTEGIPMNFTQYENQLISLSTKQTHEEKNKFLQTELDNWRGLNERDDDVLIIGFQVD